MNLSSSFVGFGCSASQFASNRRYLLRLSSVGGLLSNLYLQAVQIWFCHAIEILLTCVGVVYWGWPKVTPIDPWVNDTGKYVQTCTCCMMLAPHKIYEVWRCVQSAFTVFCCRKFHLAQCVATMTVTAYGYQWLHNIS